MRELLSARLERKLLLSESSQCYHLAFTLAGAEAFECTPGQFVSCVATDARGKQQTRAYSLASAPRGNTIEFCVNRVENGFFSNLLCDLEPGASLDLHGPHGMFTLQEPIRDSVFIATDTGIAPMRAFIQSLFPADAPARNEDRQFTLVYGAKDETCLCYHDEFEQIAARHENFVYLPTLTASSDDWQGAQGSVEEHAANLLAKRPAATDPAAATFDLYAYLCGLNEMVAPCRERLKTAGLTRKQIVFERYD